MDIHFETLQNGEKIPRLGLGTWNMGGGWKADHTHDDEEVEAIRLAVRLGCTHLDTAEGYASGHSEELVGRAVQAFKRDEVFVATKVATGDSGLHYKQVMGALPASLKRLQMDYVDLYMIHWPDAKVPLSETFRALNELAEQGKARHLGVSNFSVAQLKEAQAQSKTPIAMNQVPYSLFHREYARNGVLEYCQQTGVLLNAYTPVEVKKCMAEEVVRDIAAKHNATPVQVGLNWLIRQPNVITIPKTVREDHLRENLGAYDLVLDEEDVARLDKLA